MTALLLRLFSWRHCRLAPGTSILLVLILALGVAVYFAVRLANRAAVAGFQQFTSLLTTQSDWVITPPAGRLPESVLPELREALRDLAVHIVPVVETTGAPPRQANDGEEEIGVRTTYTLLGLDLIALQNLPVERPVVSMTEAAQFWQGFVDPLAVYIPHALAKAQSLDRGSVFPLIINERIVDLRVAGVLPDGGAGLRIPETLLVMDLPNLQALSGRRGKIDRVEFLIEPGPLAETQRAETRTILEKTSAGRWSTASPNERRESAEIMTRAFRMNLTVLSLLALMVGLYLIFQALDGAVVRRREEIGILRSLGVTARAIRRAWLAEAAVLGLAGGALGALLGWAGAQWAVIAVGRTMNSLYFASSARTASLSGGELTAAIALGVIASVIAGWWPARNAALTPPAQMLRRSGIASTPQHRRHVMAGGLLLALAALLTLVPPLRFADGGRLAVAGFFSGLLAVLGGGLLSAPAVRLVGRSLHAAGRISAPFRLALSHLRRPASRHRMAAAGLLSATAMTAGMGIMVGSFDHTMRGWIERTFVADLYISSDGAQSASSQNRLSPSTWRAILARPETGDANVIQAAPVQVQGKTTLLWAGDLRFLKEHIRMAWLERPENDAVFDAARNAELCLISEAFMDRFGLRQGNSIEVPTPAGMKTLKIAGSFADYGNERGSVMIDRAHFARWFDDEMAGSVVMFVKPGHDPETVRAGLLKDYPGLSIFTNSSLRTEILRIFNQSFAITWALELIGVCVAVIGLGLTLASMLVERRSDISTLRALGMTHNEIARSAALEGAGIALGGVVPGLLLSLGLGWILIRVINKQTFGWTLQFTIPWWQLGIFALIVVCSGTLTGWFTGRRGSKLPADREE
ncbi:MAG TPA: FtsX-like permease family protein [Verrucomicrobiales bacterium]|nr:FtsX-like permease family protein [Verrucomicrobiales bacterium]